MSSTNVFELLSQITISCLFRETDDFEIIQAMDFKREGKTGMAVTGIWPASVSHTVFSAFALRVLQHKCRRQNLQS